MGSQQCFSFSLAFLATTTILLSTNVRATQENMVELCKHTDYPALCKSIVKSVHGGAAHATKSAIEATILHAAQAKSLAIKLIASQHGQSKSNLEVCRDSYDDAITNLVTSLQNLKDKSGPDLKINLSAVITDIGTCDDCFTDSPGVVSPLSKINTFLQQLASNSLALACELKI